VQIVVHDAAPGDPEPGWEDVVEVSAVVPDGARVRWPTWAGEDERDLDSVLPGSYGVQVSARGRDAGREDATYWHREVGGTA